MSATPRLIKFAAALRTMAGSGLQPVAQRAAAKLDPLLRAELAGHVRTGLALGTAAVEGLPLAVRVTLINYTWAIPDAPLSKALSLLARASSPAAKAARAVARKARRAVAARARRGREKTEAGDLGVLGELVGDAFREHVAQVLS